MTSKQHKDLDEREIANDMRSQKWVDVHDDASELGDPKRHSTQEAFAILRSLARRQNAHVRADVGAAIESLEEQLEAAQQALQAILVQTTSTRIAATARAALNPAKSLNLSDDLGGF